MVPKVIDPSKDGSSPAENDVPDGFGETMELLDIDDDAPDGVVCRQLCYHYLLYLIIPLYP